MKEGHTTIEQSKKLAEMEAARMALEGIKKR